MYFDRDGDIDAIIFGGLWVIISSVLTAFIRSWIDIHFFTIAPAVFMTIAYFIATYYLITVIELKDLFPCPIWPLFSILPYGLWWKVFDELSDSKWPFIDRGFSNPHPEWYATNLFQWSSLFLVIGILYIIAYAIKNR